ncbi:MAG: TRAP transporter substrate-binding protein DctP [Rhodospirillaceae bacterium]
MRNAVIGIIAGIVIGVVIGVSVIAPRLKASLPVTAAKVVAELSQPEVSPAPPLEESQTSASAGTPLEPSYLERLVPPPDAPPVIRWRMASAFAGALPHLGAQGKRIETEIWRISAGGMEVAFHEPDALVPEKNLFEAVKSGAIDAAFAGPDAWPLTSPAMQLMGSVPFGPRADEYLAWFYFGGGEKLMSDITAPMGVQVLICGLVAPEGAGWYRRPVKTLEDLKGLRVRMTGLGAKVMSRLGVKTLSLSEGETFHALETGDIDAAEYSMPAIDQQLGLHRMARNYYFPGWHQPATLLPLIVNKAKWEALPAAQRSQLRAVCGDNVRHALAEGEALQYRALLAITKEGVTVRRWPREILVSLEKAWTETAAAAAKADRDFKRVWDSISRFRADYAVWRELGNP